MNIYWNLKHVPELKDLHRGERRRVHRASLRQLFKRARITKQRFLPVLIAIAALLAVMLPVIFAGSSLLGPFFFEHLWVQLLVVLPAALLGRFVFMLVIVTYFDSLYRECVREELRSFGVA